MFPAAFFQLAVVASNAELEVTVAQLFTALEFNETTGTLDKLTMLHEVLERAKLFLRPDLTKGDLGTTRILFVKS